VVHLASGLQALSHREIRQQAEWLNRQDIPDFLLIIAKKQG
jgi:hypothetical protein